jgi:hypothetical protein
MHGWLTSKRRRTGSGTDGARYIHGNNCRAIAVPPAARMAPLRTMAKRLFGSSLSTATNKKAPVTLIAEA